MQSFYGEGACVAQKPTNKKAKRRNDGWACGVAGIQQAWESIKSVFYLSMQDTLLPGGGGVKAQDGPATVSQVSDHIAIHRLQSVTVLFCLATAISKHHGGNC